MPRRRTEPDVSDVPPLPMLPPPRPTTRHGHEHQLDPYEAPPGAVPVKAIRQEPLTRKLTKGDIRAREESRLEAQARAERYMRYLDLLSQTGGDDITALMSIYGISEAETQARRLELKADIRKGMVTSSLAETLERHDLDQFSRIALLRKHAYSNIPAASLKAIDMLSDMEGDRHDVGSFESYLRIVKAQRGK